MIPAGYLYKKIVARPDWLNAPGRPKLIFSMCSHISPDFADYIDFWRHNGFWLFDRPEIIEAIAMERRIDLTGLTCCYYEEYESEYDTALDRWLPIVPEKSFPTAVVAPTHAALQGYDIVTFSMGNAPECSPLSCNNLATEIAVNDNCLIDRFEDAKRVLEAGLFRHAEPGPCRIVAVYTVDRRPPAA